MHGSKRPGPKGRCFIYAGREVRGLGELAEAAGLPLTTVRTHADAAVDCDLDIKPHLDHVRHVRDAKEADPHIGDDRRSMQMLYAGRTFPSKKALAQYFATDHNLKWRAV